MAGQVAGAIVAGAGMALGGGDGIKRWHKNKELNDQLKARIATLRKKRNALSDTMRTGWMPGGDFRNAYESRIATPAEMKHDLASQESRGNSWKTGGLSRSTNAGDAELLSAPGMTDVGALGELGWLNMQDLGAKWGVLPPAASGGMGAAGQFLTQAGAQMLGMKSNPEQTPFYSSAAAVGGDYGNFNQQIYGNQNGPNTYTNYTGFSEPQGFMPMGQSGVNTTTYGPTVQNAEAQNAYNGSMDAYNFNSAGSGSLVQV